MSEQSDYEVGYKRPPKHSQFKRGSSGNPMGRRKGAKNVSTLLTAALREPVTIVVNGKRTTVTKLEAAIKQMVNKSASGDHRALQEVLRLQLAIEEKANPGKEHSPEWDANTSASLKDLFDLIHSRKFEKEAGGVSESAEQQIETHDPVSGNEESENDSE